MILVIRQRLMETIAVQFLLDGERVLAEQVSISLALKHFLWQGFEKFLAQNPLVLTPTACFQTWQDLPVNRERRLAPVTYTSAIAQPLAHQLNCPPALLAQQLAHCLPNREIHSPTTCHPLKLTLSVNEFGWLLFTLSDSAIAHWLNQLFVTLGQLIHSDSNHLAPSSSVSSFPLSQQRQILFGQYAHGRCCSLVRLGHREHLIELDSPESFHWQWRSPRPIPWLDEADSATALRLTHNAEWQLLAQLQILSDTFAVDPEPIHDLKLAIALSQSLLAFDAQCRIFGSTQRHHPQLAQARLALAAITQLTLKYWLIHRLHLPAPDANIAP